MQSAYLVFLVATYFFRQLGKKRENYLHHAKALLVNHVHKIEEQVVIRRKLHPYRGYRGMVADLPVVQRALHVCAARGSVCARRS